MGQKRSWIPYVTAVLAFVGILAGPGACMNYVMVFDWPHELRRQAVLLWPSFVPITFELMVLFAAIGTAIVAIVAGKRTPSPSRRRC